MAYRKTALIALFLMASTMGSAASAAQEEAAPVDTLYLTGGIISEAPAGAVYFRTHTEAPTKTASEKAYHATSLMGTTYQNRFTYVPAVDIEINGPVTSKVWVSCDFATVFTHGVDGTLSSSTFTILRGTTAVSGASASRYDAAATCTGPSSVRQLTYTVEVDGLKFKAGETINFQYNLWSVNTGHAVLGNAHFLVNSTTHPASVSASGLLGAPVANVQPEVFNVTGPIEPIQAVPDSTVTAMFTVANAGASDANYTVNATGVPEGLNVTFDAPNGTLGTNMTTNVTATIAISADAPLGIHAINITIRGPAGGNATLILEVEVQTTQLGTSTDATTAANETGNQTAAAADAAGSGIPAPSLVLVSASLAAALYVARRRR